MPTLRDHLIEDNHRPAGYAWLVAKYDLKAPLRRITVVSTGDVKGKKRTDGTTTLRDRRDWPGDTDVAHLDFAMRHEPLDLLLLKKAFEAVDPADLTAFIEKSRFSVSTRRLWFMYEWFTGTKLAVADLGSTATIDMLDADSYYALASGVNSTRHRVRNNLPGTRDYCAIARRSPVMDRAPEMSAAVKQIVEDADPNTLRRAAAFLLLKDSKSSFEIEGENPPQKRLDRWGKALGKAGKQPLSVDLLADLQREVLGDQDHIAIGLRTNGVWLGGRDRENNPKPDAIGARPEDLDSWWAA